MSDILLYHYYFEGIPTPLIIQATHREEARLLIPQAIELNEPYHGKTEKDIIGESVAEPVTGISKRMIDGELHVWAGQHTGWILEKKETTDAAKT